MDTETITPALDAAKLDQLRTALETHGPGPAIDALCEELRTAEDFQALFYALLMKKRVELGVSPFPSGPSADLPPETHEAYEESIRDAGRLVGGIFLERRQFARAWGFFRMLGEIEPMREALAAYTPSDEDDTYSIVDIAWQQGVLPQKGFDLILDRHGICSAITMVSSADLSQNPDLRTYCIGNLVRALHQQLLERLRGDLGATKDLPANATIPQMVAAFPDLCADDIYHIDISHLQSVVQMASLLPKGPELDLAIDLCAYGAKLSPNLRGDMPAPFDGGYTDYAIYFNLLMERDVEAGLKHFRGKLAEARLQQDTYPAEVLVNLLVKLNRVPEALAVAREELAEAGPGLSCPSVMELARQANDFSALADAARISGDPVNYLAGLIAARM